eukprot:scaffold73_cov103-Skeletonema_marinoi.AAC.2
MAYILLYHHNHKRSLEAVHCDIHSVRYDMVLECGVSGPPKWASSGHLRGWPLEAVDCHIHSIKYDVPSNVMLAALPNGLHQATYEDEARQIYHT